MVKWCSGIACNWCVSLDISLILALNNDNNNITSIALKSSGARAQKRNKTSNHIQEPGTYRGQHQFKEPPTMKSNFEKISFDMFTERGKTFTRFQCGWEFIPNDGCSNRESTLAQVQFSSGNRRLL